VLAACEGAFGETATYQPKGGASFPITGIFNENYEQVTFHNEAPVASTRPMLGVRASGFPSGLPIVGDLVTLRGQTWRIVSPIEPDGMGHLRLFLLRAE